jgi:murein DD-endopeptidase
MDTYGTTWPARGRISSPYGPRIHPTLGTSKHHNGLDIAVPVGTPILAMQSGVVQRIDRDGQGKGVVNGNAILLRHSGGPSGLTMTAYLHLDRLDVRVGERVREGQQIGLSGATGRVTGPHLHFMTYRDGQPVDPMVFLRQARSPSPRPAPRPNAGPGSGGLLAAAGLLAGMVWLALR